jgi:hypothetical protein
MVSNPKAEEATRTVEALLDRLREILLRLPPEAQIGVVHDLDHALDRWVEWFERVGTWDTTRF